MAYYPPKPIEAIDNRPLPVSLDDLKEHVRIEHEDQQRLILTKIQAATYEVEAYIDRPVMARAMRLTMPSFADGIIISTPPLISVSAIKYLDSAEVEQTVDPAVYRISDAASYPSIVLKAGQSWPADLLAADDAVRVEYLCGFAQKQSEVPFDLREAIILRAATRLTMTEESGTGAVLWSISEDLAMRSLLAAYRLAHA